MSYTGNVNTTFIDDAGTSDALCYVYFYHIEEARILPVYPDTITDNQSANFQPTNALSRSAPVFTYSNTGARTVSVTLSLHRDLFNEVNRSGKFAYKTLSNDKEPIDELVRLFLACALPKYQATDTNIYGVIPPRIAIRFGNQIFIKGVITSDIGVTYGKPILSDAKYAKVDILFTVSETDAYDAPTVAQLGSFRSIASGI